MPQQALCKLECWHCMLQPRYTKVSDSWSLLSGQMGAGAKEKRQVMVCEDLYRLLCQRAVILEQNGLLSGANMLCQVKVQSKQSLIVM